MFRLLIILGLLISQPSLAFANNFEFDYSGLIGGYFGFADTRTDNNVYNNPHRWVYRADAKFKADYVFSSEHRLGLHSNVTIMNRDPDPSYPHGDWRFYPYLIDKSNYGEFSAGYTYNVAYLLHKGARDITFFKIDDSNMTYFLSNPNWGNSKKSVKFLTPKSTSIMNDGRAPKFNYISPKLGNTLLGFSYTPSNAHRRGMTSRYADYETNEDGYTAAMQNEWKLDANNKIYTSFGYGIFNRTDHEASFGVTLVSGDWDFGVGYKKAYIDGNKNPITTKAINKYLPAYFDNFRESQAYNISVGRKFGKYKTNLAYLHTKADNTRNQDDLVVFSNVYSYNKWIDLFLVGSYLNAKGLKRDSDANNKGYAVVTGVGLNF